MGGAGVEDHDEEGILASVDGQNGVRGMVQTGARDLLHELHQGLFVGLSDAWTLNLVIVAGVVRE